MHRQGFDLQLTQYDQRGWRATFYTTGHGALADERDSPIPPGGSRLDATGLPRRHDPLASLLFSARRIRDSRLDIMTSSLVPSPL